MLFPFGSMPQSGSQNLCTFASDILESLTVVDHIAPSLHDWLCFPVKGSDLTDAFLNPLFVATSREGWELYRTLYALTWKISGGAVTANVTLRFLLMVLELFLRADPTFAASVAELMDTALHDWDPLLSCVIWTVNALLDSQA